MAEKPIQNCHVRFQFKCPMQWDALQETAEAGVRWCGSCHKRVYLSQSTQEAAQHARAGHCVAVPVGLVSPKDSIQLHGRELDLDMFRRVVPLELARKHSLVPLSRVGSTLTVAMSDPTHSHAIDDLKFLTGCNVEVKLASPQDILEALERAELELSRIPNVELGVMACEEEPE
ncbi:hypothetical protein [Archangium lansingense]|uniref:Type II secretion system protein GspE N-terminal domain-containing protein n=1 Tax=Archangium lansingense TaxID=2995310 RepID=A0ABT4ALE1_9BACT|nr:hypothetical protein [Archangium lansinium]MCY1082508.1 hypothetical protein [Archangium lansinium]